MDYTGKIISKTSGQPTQASASGVWTLDEAAAAVKNNSWPIPGVPNPISKSLRFNSADTAYLNRTPSSAGNRRTWTWSGWVKRSVTGVETNVFVAGPYVSSAFKNFRIRFTSGEALEVYNYDSSYQIQLISSAVYRDPSAWYHIVVAVDTTQATNTNRVKVYVNGIQVTAFGTATYPNQNLDTEINTTEAHYLGFKYSGDGNGWFSGYLTEINFIDGQALTPSSFGQTNANTGVWEPKPYTGTYGTNGFYLNFKDSATTTALGYDYSGNGNNWTPNNFSVTAGAGNDSLVDVPTQWIGYNTSGDTGGIWRGNYATWNPLWLAGTFTNGNLDATTATGDSAVGTTFGMSSGKWYAEMLITRTAPTTAGAAYITVGLIPSTMPAGTTTGYTATSYGYYSQTGNKVNNSGGSAYGASYTVNDVIGIAFDADAGTLTFYKNGSSQGTAFSSIPAGTYFFAIGDGDGSATASATLNAGQRPFAYTPPAGFVSLCTTNLPTPTIGATSTTQANDYFDIVTYTGTGSSNSITGYDFQPDLVWIKSTVSSFDHAWYDAVRGVQKQLECNNTDAETTETTGLTAFNSGGFTVGTLAQVNTTTTYIAWAWKANGAGSANTAGSISSTVSANTAAGFSIVTYTGTGANATVGHGCLVNSVATAPRFIICKERNTAGYDWRCYHASLGATQYIDLNSTAAAATASTIWQNTAPTSTVFSVGTNGSVNVNTGSFVAYCFAEVAGYSAFGSYTGNGSTDGPFVYTGFRPRWTLFKRTDTGATTWVLYDTKRNPYNIVNDEAYPALNQGFGTANRLDILSNGFKMRNTISELNANGGTYIYAVFAENPFKYSLAR